MKLDILKLDQIIFQGEVSQIKARSPLGEFLVLEGHAPMVAVLKPGQIFVEEKVADHFREVTFDLGGGVLKVTPHEAVVLAE